MLNPADIVRTSFKILSRQRKSVKKENPEETAETKSLETAPEDIAQVPAPPTPETDVKQPSDNESFLYSQDSVSQDDDSRRSNDDDDSSSRTSMSVYDDERTDGKSSISRIEQSLNDKEGDLTDKVRDGKGNAASINRVLIGVAQVLRGEQREKKKRRRFFKQNLTSEDDRRRKTWLPCTCPQYKVSNELATKWSAQAAFFGKVMLIKVIQLFVINLAIFTTGYLRDDTLQFFSDCHDWAFLAFGLFVAMLVSIRVLLSYRARWPVYFSLILMTPLTAIIAFISACITVIYNSVLIPIITCSVLVSFLLLTFLPFFLGKPVMHRIVNIAGVLLTLVSSIGFLFLKELEEKEITYWDFLAYVWLPAACLSQVIVLVSIIEIQRMLFGLCFNVSTKRWHVAALYL